MTSNRFFIDKGKLKTPYVLLEGDEHHHLSRVSRIKLEDKVWLFDERGAHYLARVEEITEGWTKLRLLEEKKQEQPKLNITLAQALIKSKNMELIIQKSTELGISRFIPVITSRSVVKIEEKIEKKLQRWQKIACEAVKQCGASWIPRIQFPLSLRKVVKEHEEKKIFLSENRGKFLKEILLERKRPPASLMIIVGPEGGWTDEEEGYMLKKNCEAASLGHNILRTETAAISSLALVSHFWNL